MALYILDTAQTPPSLTPYSPPVVVPPPAPISVGEIGINLTSINDYAPASLFENMALQARDWRLNGAVGVTFDANGWPLTMPSGASIDSVLSIAENASIWPAGTYYVSSTSRVGGRWYLKYSDQTLITISPIDGTFKYDPKKGGLWLTVTAPGLINFRLVLSGANTILNSDYGARLTGFKTLRFMDLLNTNNSTVSSVPVPASIRSYALSGITPEGIGQICTEFGTNAWVNIPHLATDGWVRDFAKRLRATMPATAKLYVEYSNECWNSQFSQAAYCLQMARNLGLRPALTDFERQLRFAAQRGVDVGNLVKSIYGPMAYTVIAGQAANPWTGQVMLDQAGVGADHYAVASYFGYDIHGSAGATQPVVASAIDKALADAKTNAGLAAKAGCKFSQYECNSHIIPASAADVAALVKLEYETPWFKDEFARYLKGLKALNTGVMCLFADLGTPSQAGLWGMLRNLDDTQNAKWQSVRSIL